MSPCSGAPADSPHSRVAARGVRHHRALRGRPLLPGLQGEGRKSVLVHDPGGGELHLQKRLGPDGREERPEVLPGSEGVEEQATVVGDELTRQEGPPGRPRRHPGEASVPEATVHEHRERVGRPVHHPHPAGLRFARRHENRKGTAFSGDLRRNGLRRGSRRPAGLGQESQNQNADGHDGPEAGPEPFSGSAGDHGRSLCPERGSVNYKTSRLFLTFSQSPPQSPCLGTTSPPPFLKG